MNNKLVCPFCGEEIKIAGERTTIMSCFNGECCGSGLYGEEAMWQALIQAKQDLEIATKALEEVRDETGEDRAGFSYVILAANMKETAEKALETIGKHNE